MLLDFNTVELSPIDFNDVFFLSKDFFVAQKKFRVFKTARRKKSIIICDFFNRYYECVLKKFRN